MLSSCSITAVDTSEWNLGGGTDEFISESEARVVIAVPGLSQDKLVCRLAIPAAVVGSAEFALAMQGPGTWIYSF